MKIKMSQISRAVSLLVNRLKKNEILQDEKVTNVKVQIGDKEVVCPDKQWFCANINKFEELVICVNEILTKDVEKK